jgi:hypothetical protein
MIPAHCGCKAFSTSRSCPRDRNLVFQRPNRFVRNLGRVTVSVYRKMLFTARDGRGDKKDCSASQAFGTLSKAASLAIFARRAHADHTQAPGCGASCRQ